MLEALVTLLEVLTPVFVAVVTTFGAVLVAKVNKLQKDAQTTNDKVTKVQADIVTNHGSKNLGDAIDIIRTKVDVMSDNQDDLISTVKGLHRRDDTFDRRIHALEGVAARAEADLERAEKVVTDSIHVVAAATEEKEKE